MDLSWFYQIGRTKLALTTKEIGRMTLTLFNKLYDHYKQTFDFEMMLYKSGLTHTEAYNKSQESDKWF